jgi:predicted nuclease of restriction endonuclease-like (RecB) superfamily
MTDALVPGGYGDLLAQIKSEVRVTRLQVARTANSELLAMYWRIGRLILSRQETEPWGSGVIKRLSRDLRGEFPDMKGLSPTNLQYMRAFAAAWPNAISQRPVGKLPWGHVCTLLDQVRDPALRDWYADRDARNGWSRPVLEHHVATGLHQRVGAAPSNFDQQLDPLDADQAREIVRDPYIFDFLDLTERSTERALEQALTDRLQDTLAELGPGFAFVGRQHRFTVDNQDFHVDLLLFHIPTVRYVVIELKAGRFRHEYAGQLGFYVSIVDDQLRNPAAHAPTVGILLCTSSTENTVKYALRATNAPMAVATYTYEALPPAEKAALPPVDAVTHAFTGTATGTIRFDGRVEESTDSTANDSAD